MRCSQAGCEHEVVAQYSVPTRPTGYSCRIHVPLAKHLAEALGLPITVSAFLADGITHCECGTALAQPVPKESGPLVRKCEACLSAALVDFKPGQS